jgi:hypothetical protein
MNWKYVTNYFEYFLLSFCSVISVPNLHTAWIACRTDIAAVVWTQYKVWPVVDWINFTYVPEPLRVLFCSAVTLFWNVYISRRLAAM